MIISRTPLRVSFFGGGTDHPSWFKHHGKGAVLSTSIDKYVYTILRPLPPIFDFKYRVAWRMLEQVNTVDEIQHPVVREVLRNYAPDTSIGYELAYNADLPARSGLGSSSAFSVSALHALKTHLGEVPDKMELALEAIRVEQDFLKEPVGSQDQTAAAFGGLNRIDFNADGTLDVCPVDVSPKRKQAFDDHLMMFFTRFTRSASDIEKKKIDNFEAKKNQLNRMYDMVAEGCNILEDRNLPLSDLGELLDEAWKAKRSLSKAVSNGPIDGLYRCAMEAGAYGGKLLGAGGGGFVLMMVAPERQDAVREAICNHELEPGRYATEVRFCMENEGSQIVLHKPELNEKFLPC